MQKGGGSRGGGTPGRDPRNGAIKTSGGETEVEAHRRVDYRHMRYLGRRCRRCRRSCYIFHFTALLSLVEGFFIFFILIFLNSFECTVDLLQYHLQIGTVWRNSRTSVIQSPAGGQRARKRMNTLCPALIGLTSLHSNASLLSDGGKQPPWITLMCTQGWGLNPWNYTIQIIQSASLPIVTQIKPILFGRNNNEVVPQIRIIGQGGR